MSYEFNINGGTRFVLTNGESSGIENIRLEGSVIITEDLTVLGNNTVLETSTVTIEDTIITIGRGTAELDPSDAFLSGGLIVERPSGENHKGLWYTPSAASFIFGETTTDSEGQITELSPDAYTDVSMGHLTVHYNAEGAADAYIGDPSTKFTSSGTVQFGKLSNAESTNIQGENASFENPKDVRVKTGGAVREEVRVEDSSFGEWRVRTSSLVGAAGSEIVYDQDLYMGNGEFTYNGDTVLTMGSGDYVVSINDLQGVVEFRLFDLLDVEGDHQEFAGAPREDGKYLKFNASEGVWLPSFITQINEIENVNANEIAGRVLQYRLDSSDGVYRWMESTVAMPEKLFQLLDVDMSTETEAEPGQSLIWFEEDEVSGAGFWRPSFIPSIHSIMDVESTLPDAGDEGKALIWNNTLGKWVLSATSFVEVLDDLADVNGVLNLDDKAFLKYDLDNSQWAPGFVDDIGEITNVREMSNGLSQDNNLLKYNFSDQIWEAGIIDDLAEIGNVYISDYGTVEEGHTIKWDVVNARWVTGPSLSRLFDVTDVKETEGSMAEGRFLVWRANGPDGPGWYQSDMSQVQVLDDLNDVIIDQGDLSDGKILRYNSSLSQWEPGIIQQITEIGDVTIDYDQQSVNGIRDQHVLKWNGSRFVNGFVSKISDIENVDAVDNPTDGDFLRYVESTGRWTNSPINSIDEIVNVQLGGIADGKVLEWDSSANAGQGAFVPSAGSRVEYFGDLVDVTVPEDPSQITVGSALRFNGSKWTPYDYSFPEAIGDMNNVIITGPVTGDALLFNGTDWVNGNIPHPTRLEQLRDDVDLDTPLNGEVLMYDGTNWINSTAVVVDVLDDLDDVELNSPRDDQFLRYDIAEARWKNQTVKIPLNILDLEDVNPNYRLPDDNPYYEEPQTGEVLRYNGVFWEGVTLPVYDQLGDLLDVSISGAAVDHVLYYNGAGWQNRKLDFISNMDDLLDVSADSPTNGSILIYDGPASEWVASSVGDLNIVIDDLDDVDTLNVQAGHVLTAVPNGDGFSWTNQAPAYSTLGSLDDVNDGSRALGKYLRYDGTRWVASELVTSEILDSLIEELSLDELGDVTIDNTLDTGHMLVHVEGVWVNQNVGEAFGQYATIGDLGNVTADAPLAGDTIVYDDVTGRYVSVNLVQVVKTGLNLAELAGTENGEQYVWDATGAEWVVKHLGDPSGEPDAGKVLTWDGTKWTTQDLPEDKFIKLLSELDDVQTDDLASIQNNQILRWNAASQYWENVDWPSISLHMLEDVDFVTPGLNDLVAYDGTSWVNLDLPVIAGNVLELDNLSNVNASVPSDHQVLAYSAANGEWQSTDIATVANNNLNLSDLADVFDGVSPSGETKYLAWDFDNSRWSVSSVSLNAFAINELSNVTISSPAAGNFLRFDGVEWINDSVIIPTTLNSLLDVSTTNPTDGAFLAYEEDSNEWVARSYLIVESLSDLSDVNTTGVQPGDTLIYQGGSWVPIQVPPVTLESRDLTDISDTAATDGQVLLWNESAGKWEPNNLPDPFIPEVLNDLSNVNVPAPSANDVLVFDNVSGEWIAAAFSTLVNVELGQITNVSLSNVADAHVLAYNSASGDWENTPIGSLGVDVGDLGDVTGTASADNRFLVYNDTTGKWDITEFQTISMIKDVNAAGAASGDALVWNGTQFVPGSPGNVNAESLNGQPASAYLRSDEADAGVALELSDVRPLAFSSSSEVRIGADSAPRLGVYAPRVSVLADSISLNYSPLDAAGVKFVPDTAPALSEAGFMWCDSSDNSLMFYNGTEQLNISNIATQNYIVNDTDGELTSLTITAAEAKMYVEGTTNENTRFTFSDKATDKAALVDMGASILTDIGGTNGNAGAQTVSVTGKTVLYSDAGDVYRRNGSGTDRLATIADIQAEIITANASYTTVSGNSVALSEGNSLVRYAIPDNTTSVMNISGLDQLETGNSVVIAATANTVISNWGANSRLRMEVTGLTGMYVNGVYTSGTTHIIDLSATPNITLYFYEDGSNKYFICQAS